MAGNPKSNPSGIHVVIIGAGLTGLLIAQGLKKAGISYSIFEKESLNSPRARSWTLGVHWGAADLKSLLPESLHSRLRETYCDPFYPYDQPVESIQLYNGKTGSIIKKVPVPGLKRVDRKRLRSLCSEGLDIQYDKALVSLKYDAGGEEVTAIFEDGSHVTANLIIGAEGAGSVVREEILGKEKAEPNVTSDLVNMMTIVNYEDAEKARHIREVSGTFGTAHHPDGIFSMVSIQNVTDPNDPNTWTFHLVTSWLKSKISIDESQGLVEAMREVGEYLAEPFSSAHIWIPDGVMIWKNKIKYWIPVPWDNHGGRVTLAGDAAHPMLPYRGQGLNHCICDAAKLVGQLTKIQSKGQLAEAISMYEAEMIPRGKAEVESAIENTYMIHDGEKLMESPLMKSGAAKTS